MTIPLLVTLILLLIACITVRVQVLVQAQANDVCESDDSSSSSTYRYTYKWTPESKHPCTLERLSTDEYERRFGPKGLPPLYPTPLVIVPSKEYDWQTNIENIVVRNGAFRDMTQYEKLLDFFPPDFAVTLSSSNSFSEHRKTVLLADYLHGLLVTTDTLPDQLSNETWYFFGETYSPEWKQLLVHYEIPICHACDRDMVALSFGIGNRGSGVQWHVHGPGFAETLWGRKHWVLSKDRPDFHPDQTSRNWMEFNYTTLPPNERPLECTLEPGDILYFPDMWYHATINLDPYTAFVSTFTQEHLYVQS